MYGGLLTVLEKTTRRFNWQHLIHLAFRAPLRAQTGTLTWHFGISSYFDFEQLRGMIQSINDHHIASNFFDSKWPNWNERPFQFGGVVYYHYEDCNIFEYPLTIKRPSATRANRKQKGAFSYHS